MCPYLCTPAYFNIRVVVTLPTNNETNTQQEPQKRAGKHNKTRQTSNYNCRREQVSVPYDFGLSRGKALLIWVIMIISIIVILAVTSIRTNVLLLCSWSMHIMLPWLYFFLNKYITASRAARRCSRAWRRRSSSSCWTTTSCTPYIISYHIISYHIISYNIISYHIISYRVIQNIYIYIYIYLCERGQRVPRTPPAY